MRFFGFDITRKKTIGPTGPYDRPSAWWPISVHEPFTGAWQRNMELRNEDVLAYNAVFACVTLIASDISKVRLRLVEQDGDGIWSEVDRNSPFWPVIRKPNDYQTRIKFIEQWVVSKLLHGNAYILKQRDQRGIVTGLYVLNPLRTKALVAPDGSIYYEITKDALSGVEQDNTRVPASEIIHDTMVSLYHPLCGVSPLTACGIAAVQGLAVLRNSTAFFQNGSRPSGILTAPGHIDPDDAKRLKEHFEQGYNAGNAGRIAVMGDDLTYLPMTMSAVDAQLIEQLKMTAENVCSCFHVPPYMIGVGPAPTYNNIEALNQQYYTQCLQSLIESIELCLDEGLGLTTQKDHAYGTEFDLDDLLRMDTATKVKTAVEGLKGIFTPNDARKKFDLKPVAGGDAVYLQQQNYSTEALAKRDALADPFGTAAPAPAPSLEPANDNTDEEIAVAAAVAGLKLKSLLLAA